MQRNKRMKLFQILILLCAVTTAAAQTKKGPPVKKSAPVKAASSNPLNASVTRGKAVYAANCLVCHQADGGGVGNLNPPLIKTTWVLGDKPTLIQFVLKGGKGQVEIDGETFHNAMPAQAHLTDAQLADVLTYVRNSFGNKATAVTIDEVAVERTKIK